MVKLIDGYSITADAYQYILRLTSKQNRTNRQTKQMEEVEVTLPVGYYPTFQSAVNGCVDKICREIIASDEIKTIKEYANQIAQVKSDICAVVERSVDF